MTDLFTLTPRPVLAYALLLVLTPFAAYAQDTERATPPPPAPRALDFPKWSEFPPPPKDVPTAAEIKTRVLEVQGVGFSVQQTVNAIVWELDQPPQTYATMANARIDPLLSAPVKPLDTAEIESFAAKLRARSTPPPVEN